MTTRTKLARAAVYAVGLAVAAMAADQSTTHHMSVLASIAFAGSVLSVFGEWAARIGRSPEFTFTCSEPGCTVAESATTNTPRTELERLDAFTADHTNH